MRLKHLLVFTAAIVFESAAYCQSWNLTSLFSFPGGAGGGNPNYLMLAPDGSIIGTTTIANTKDCTTCGTVYRLVPPSGGTGAWTHTVLFGFPDQATDGEQPNSVVLGPGGVLYGATGTGGPSTCGGLGCGTIFELTSGTTPWTETVLLDFNGDRGQSPGGPLRLGHNGALYGTASQLVYDLVPPTGGTGPWAEHRLYAFTGDGTERIQPDTGCRYRSRQCAVWREYRRRDCRLGHCLPTDPSVRAWWRMDRERALQFSRWNRWIGA